VGREYSLDDLDRLIASNVRWKNSSCQLLLQLLPMPLNQIHQQRRNTRSAAYLQGACEGHTIQQLVDIDR
jgi:hypothetical protein